MDDTKNRFVIREFKPQDQTDDRSPDWLAIQKLLNDTPIATDTQLIVSRIGSYQQSFPTLYAQPRRFLIAETSGVVIGILGFEMHNIRVGNTIEKYIYVGDGRIRNDFQKRGVMQLLIAELNQISQRENAPRGYFFASPENISVASLLKNLPNSRIHKAASTRMLLSAVLFPGANQGQQENFIEFAPNKESFERYLEKTSACLWSPQYEANLFENFQKNMPGLHFFADKRSPTEIAFALWDQYAFKQFKKPLEDKEKLLRMAWNLLCPLTKSPSFPDSNQPWHQVDLCFVDPSLGKDERVPAFAYNWAKKQKANFVTFYSLQHSARGLYKTGALQTQLKITAHLDLYTLEFDKTRTKELIPGDHVYIDSVFF